MMKTDVVPKNSDVTKVGKKKRCRHRGGKRRSRGVRFSSSATLVDKLISPVKCAVHVFLFRYQSTLRRVPAHLPPNVHAGPPSKRVKRVSWRDEEGSPKSGGTVDPAVLAVGPVRKPIIYTRDQMMKLKNSPFSKCALDPDLLSSDSMALVLKKSSDSADDERGGRGDAANDNQKGGYNRERRSADPRERVRRESECGGIVLSPQRRSFTSGCSAPATREPAPTNNGKPDHTRRIGSGRIITAITRDAPNTWERSEQPENEREQTREVHRESHRERERPEREIYRPPNRDRDRDERMTARTNGDRFERRSFSRDNYSNDMKRDRDERFNDNRRERDDNRRNNGRYGNRRYEKDDEPEWFSGGPTSQLETIELRGFDEPKKANNTSKDSENTCESSEVCVSPPVSSSPVPPANSVQHNQTDEQNDKDSGVESKVSDEPQSTNEHPDFNLDEFLKMEDTVYDMLTNGVSDSTKGGSRFSHWFNRESPTNDTHYERLMHDIIDDLEEPNTSKPLAPAQSFLPLGTKMQNLPHPPHHPPHHPPLHQQNVSLLELMRRANEQEPLKVDPSIGSKMHSLEELEARLRPQPDPLPDRDLSAFKRLLAQVSGGHAVPATTEAPPRPMSLLQMLNKSMEQQKAPQQPHIPQELLYKLLQVQQRQQQPEMAQPVPPNLDRELLNRPEAQAIINGLKNGEISAQSLMSQISNPALQNRHRELLISILRMHQHHHHRQMGSSPLPNVGPQLVVPHHQPLNISPLPHAVPGVNAHIPSPRELAAHTQSIMQSALIKKKLEEQRENYRRRQENKPTPISFMPTSVLRKMTAEKESESSQKQAQWVQPPKMPQGRPIVKGNQNQSAMNYHPHNEYQQFLNQQQQIANMRSYQQQRQMPPPQQMNNMNNLTRGVASGTTLQQLLMQSHQRAFNEGSGPGEASAGGDNQLARWFSPELLARANAGKLPSARVPNALALEDLERNHHSPAPPLRN